MGLRDRSTTAHSRWAEGPGLWTVVGFCCSQELLGDFRLWKRIFILCHCRLAPRRAVSWHLVPPCRIMRMRVCSGSLALDISRCLARLIESELRVGDVQWTTRLAPARTADGHAHPVVVARRYDALMERRNGRPFGDSMRVPLRLTETRTTRAAPRLLIIADSCSIGVRPECEWEWVTHRRGRWKSSPLSLKLGWTG